MRAVAAGRESEKTGAASVVAADAAPRPTRLYHLVYLASLLLVEQVYRLRVDGVEHVPARGGFVVAANHTSDLDPWPLGIALWPRSLHFMAKHEVWWPPLKWLIAAVGSFPVRGGEGDAEALATAVRIGYRNSAADRKRSTAGRRIVHRRGRGAAGLCMCCEWR